MNRFKQPVWVSIVWSLALTVWGGDVLRAQETDAPVYGEVVDVYVVNVEVRVTDRKDRPISGLSIDDFTLRENGKVVPIVNFAEIPPRRPAQGPGALPELAERPIRPTPANMIFLIDNYAVDASSRRRVLDELRRLLKDGIDGTSQVAIAAYDGTLRVIEQPTSDRQRLLAAVDQAAEGAAQGVLRHRQRQIQLRNVLTVVGETRSGVRSGIVEIDEAVERLQQLTREVQLEADRRRSENRHTFESMGALIDGLASLAGRKALVYISEGLAMRPGEAELQVIQDALAEITSRGGGASGGDIDSRSAALGALADQAQPPPRRRRKKAPPPDELFAVTALAAQARVSFYPWAAQGNVGGVAAEVGGEAALGLTAGVSRARQESLVDTLGVLAVETGGKMVVGASLEGLVDDAVEDFGGYYSIGFSPDHGGDGRLHELKVKVRSRGSRVWHPSSYIAR